MKRLRTLLPLILGCLLILQGFIALSQDRPALPPDLLTQQTLTQAKVEELKSAIANPHSEGNSFLPLAVLAPQAVAATTNFIFMASATSFISLKLAEDLNVQLGALDVDGLSPIQLLENIQAILNVANLAIQRTSSNVEKLREIGYTDADLDSLAHEISEKNKQCSDDEINNSPDNFCPDYADNFSREKFTVEKSSGGWIVKNRKGKVQCCLEWDRVHCGFEIFDKRGQHQGEVGCLADEFNPCEANLSRGRHARPQRNSHHPRSKACSK